MQTRTMLSYALEYAELGWHVFPVGKNKRPLTAHGFIDATNLPRKVSRFWKKFPDANIGIATGKLSGIVVLDVDPKKEGVEQALKELVLRKGKFPQTVVAKSGGGGYHFYFKHPGEDIHISSTVDLFGIAGIDIRADGGYIIAPPSSHESGKAYEWGTSQEPFNAELDNCPEFIIEAQKLRKQKTFTDFREPIPEGNRNTSLTQIAGVLRSLGLNSDEMLPILLQQNKARCNPPLAQEEIETIVQYVGQYPPYNTKSTSGNTLTDEMLLGFSRTDAGLAELFSQMYLGKVKYNHTNGQWYIWRGQFWELDEKQEIIQMVIQSSRELMKASTTIEDEVVRSEAIKYSVKVQNKARIDAALSISQSQLSIATTHYEWDANPNIVACLNGTINLSEGSLRSGLPSDLLAHYLPHELNPEAKSPKWEKFLTEVFDGNTSVIDFVQKAVGYSLTGRTDEQCIFVMVGKGSNGKSTFLEVMHALFGNYAIAAPFSTFERNKNSQSNDIASLAGKRLVFSSEPNQGVVFDESRIKSLTGGDTITARFLHKEFFSFQPICKIWMGVNHLPRVKDDSDGFWRRVRRIDFPVRFWPNSPGTPKGAKLQDPTLLPSLLNELPGILNWAIDGARAWYTEGLQIPESVVTATQEYRDDSDPIHVFLNTCCLLDDNVQEELDILYQAYISDAEDRGLRRYDILSASRFQERMRATFIRVDINGKPGVAGVGLNSRGAVMANPRGVIDIKIRKRKK